MIHEIGPRVFDNEYKEQTPDARSVVMCVKNGAVLIREENGEIAMPLCGEIAPGMAPLVYLFSIDDTRFFLGTDIEPFGGYAYHDMGEFRNKTPRHLAFAAVTACQLDGWYTRNRFCGRCGSETVRDNKERMLRCENCGNMIYPKISPAVIVGIIDNDKILMTKYAGRPYKNYALIAGFSEVGESIEQTVHREVLEEVGVRVKNIRFYKSQPWPFSDSLLMGFFCDLDGSNEIVLDETELAVAEWVHRDDIAVLFDGISLTNEMITRFKAYEI